MAGAEPAPIHHPLENTVFPETNYVLLSGHTASPYQAAVFDHFKTGMGSAIIKAVAGSGKTTTMKNALPYLSERLWVQMFAFNVEAANQLKDAIKELAARATDARRYERVSAGTFHSVGYAALRKALAGRRIEVDNRKCRKLFEQQCAITGNRKLYKDYGDFVCQLVGFAKGEGVGCLIPNTEEQWHRLVEHHGLYLDTVDASTETGINFARMLLNLSNEAAHEGIIDYDDMLYLVILWRLRLWQSDVVIVDEAQDTNPVRRAMLHLALKPGGRLYGVGDEKQSIFGFTGATPDALDLIMREFNARELPLTVSYRCARSIVERAQVWVPYIQPAETAPIGEVLDDYPLYAALALLTPQDAVLCRNTAPLVSLAYSMIAAGRGCRILGKEIGEGLVNLIESQKARGIDRLTKKLADWRDKQMARFIAKGQEERADAVHDRVACIMVVVDALPEADRTIPTLVHRLQSMFVDPERGVPQTLLTLSTVHKAKGKEWETVAILRPELMPARYARQDWQIDQEHNLMYVAATRAKKRLIYVMDKDMTIEAPPAVPVAQTTVKGDTRG